MIVYPVVITDGLNVLNHLANGVPAGQGNFQSRCVLSASTRTTEIFFLSGISVGEYSLSGVFVT